MFTVMVATALASIASGLFLWTLVQRIRRHVEKVRETLDRLYAAQVIWAEAYDAEKVNLITVPSGQRGRAS